MLRGERRRKERWNKNVLGGTDEKGEGMRGKKRKGGGKERKDRKGNEETDLLWRKGEERR